MGFRRRDVLVPTVSWEDPSGCTAGAGLEGTRVQVVGRRCSEKLGPSARWCGLEDGGSNRLQTGAGERTQLSQVKIQCLHTSSMPSLCLPGARQLCLEVSENQFPLHRTPGLLGRSPSSSLGFSDLPAFSSPHSSLGTGFIQGLPQLIHSNNL